MTDKPNRQDEIREAVARAILAVDATIEDPEIIADEIIAAHKRALAKAGYVIVLREPTEDMCYEAMLAHGQGLPVALGYYEDIWRAMIAKAEEEMGG